MVDRVSYALPTCDLRDIKMNFIIYGTIYAYLRNQYNKIYLLSIKYIFYLRKSSVYTLFQNYETARKLPKDKEIKGTKTLSWICYV